MSTRRCLLVLALVLTGLAFAPTARAQQLIRQVIGSGATAATNSSNRVYGTIGQPIIGRVTSSSNIGYLGFWYTYRTSGPGAVREEYSWQVTGATASMRVAPNPAVEHATITLSLPTGSAVTLRVYDALGQQRMDLINDRRSAGTTTLELPATDLESGDYTLVLTVNGIRSVAPLRIVK